MSTLGAVIVSFNTRDLLDACLTALAVDLARAGFAAGAAEVWVVDNASTDGSAPMVAARHPDVRLLALADNAGFTAANNEVLRRWAGGNEVVRQVAGDNEVVRQVAGDPRDPAGDVAPARAPDWVLLLNPDTEVQPGAIARLIAALEAVPDAAVAGPSLAYTDGRFQHGAFRFPGLIQTALDLFPRPRLMDSTFNGRYPPAVYSRGRPFPVDFVLGACMLVRGAALRRVGALDEGFFMYCEEVDWCRRFRAAGWRTLCVPAAVVVHHAGASTRQFRGPMFATLWRSRRRYFAKHAAPAKRLVLEALIRIGLAVRSARDRLEVRRGRLAPDEAGARLDAYRAVFR